MLESLILPYQPIQTELVERPAIVQMAEAKDTSKQNYDYHLTGYCDVIEFFPAQFVTPGVAMQLEKTQGHDPDISYPLDDLSEAKVGILEMPKHGQLLPATSGASLAGTAFNGGPSYVYKPDPGYVGMDSLTALIEYKGRRIKVTMDLVVVRKPITPDEHSGGFYEGSSGGGSALDKKANECTYPGHIRIRRINKSPEIINQRLNGSIADISTGDLASWQRTSDLMTLLASASQSATG